MSSGSRETSPGEDFIELGLLFIATGLAVVVVGATLQLLFLRGFEVEPAWLVYLIGAAILCGPGYLALRLVRRLLWFLRRLE